KPLWAKFGTLAGAALGGLDMWCQAILRLSPFGTLRWTAPDSAKLKPISEVTPRRYDRPDGRTTFDRASSVFLANLAHDEDQPLHLKLADPVLPVRENLPLYGE